MRIKIAEIPAKGLIIDKTIRPDEIELDPKDIGLVSGLTIKAKIDRVNDFIMAEVDASGSYGYTCARCLKDYEQTQRYHWNFDYEIDRRQKEVELGEDIRQELIMAMPMKTVCPDGCDAQTENVLKKIIKG